MAERGAGPELIGGPEPAGPIRIVAYDERWPSRFEAVADRIRDAVGPEVTVEHIGSTAVPGLAAKPIVDALLVVEDVEDESGYLPALQRAGLLLRVREPGHRLLRTPERDVHLHVYGRGAAAVDACLRFRDRLRSDPGDRARYESTKRRLAQRDWASMQEYAVAKTEVITEILGRAGHGLDDGEDEARSARQARLQEEGGQVVAELRLDRLFADVGPVLLTGSYVSGLMVWRELDVMVFGGPQLSPSRVLAALARLVTVPGVVGFDYVDERGDRSPTGEVRDERFHVATTYQRSTGSWRLDLTFWLHDLHENVTAWHRDLADSVTAEQRAAILWIKEEWSSRPEYPDLVSGFEVYTAVLDHGVRTPDQFADWLRHRD